MTLSVLQFGVSGQLGRELLRQAPSHPGLAVRALARTQADLADPAACAERVRAARPDLVVIAAAYTAVDRAESEPELCRTVNALAPAAIAAACAEVGAAVVALSTDYVFDGAKGAPYAVDDPRAPLNAYGLSKAEAEVAVLAACPRSLVLRTSWVVSPHGRNFITTMLRLAREGGEIRVVDDQIGRPTSAADLAGFILAQAPRLAAAPAGDPVFGVHHFANAGEVSWKGFAEAIFADALGAAAPPVTPIPTAARPTPAARPARGSLDTAELTRTFGVTPRPWRAALREILADLKTGADA